MRQALIASAATILMFAVAASQGLAADERRSPERERASVPVRIEIASLGIDLPVVSSDLQVPGNPAGYPLCDVAQYWTLYALPGAPGTAWIFAHARTGMFLPLLEVARSGDAANLLGLSVTAQLADGRALTYLIDTVRQHAMSRRIARRPDHGDQRLVLQTSEGPPGTIPKLQVAGDLISATWAEEPAPEPRPRACSSQATDPTSRENRADRSPGGVAGVKAEDMVPDPIELGPVVLAPYEGDPLDLAIMLLGAGCVLAGAAAVGWGIGGRRVRRQG